MSVMILPYNYSVSSRGYWDLDNRTDVIKDTFFAAAFDPYLVTSLGQLILITEVNEFIKVGGRMCLKQAQNVPMQQWGMASFGIV